MQTVRPALQMHGKTMIHLLLKNDTQILRQYNSARSPRCTERPHDPGVDEGNSRQLASQTRKLSGTYSTAACPYVRPGT